MGIISTRTLPETIRSWGFGIIGAAYDLIETPLDFPSIQMILTNTTDVDLLLSYDGVNDHLFIASGETIQLQYAVNACGDNGMFVAKLTGIYVKDNGVAPGEGAIWLMTFYPVTAAP